MAKTDINETVIFNLRIEVNRDVTAKRVSRPISIRRALESGIDQAMALPGVTDVSYTTDWSYLDPRR